MTLQTTCENCGSNWNVDQMVFCDLVGINLCPVCINNLIDALAQELYVPHLKGILENF